MSEVQDAAQSSDNAAVSGPVEPTSSAERVSEAEGHSVGSPPESQPSETAAPVDPNPSNFSQPGSGINPDRPGQAQSSHPKESVKMSETETVVETEAEAPPAEPVAKTDAQIAERLKEAQNMTKNYMFASLGTGLVPVPTVDVGILIGIQSRLLYKLAKLYDLKFTEEIGKKLLMSLMGGTLPVAGGMGLASMLKAFPGVGSWIGMTSMAVFGAAATYAVGRVFIQHFESGGNFFNFDPAKTRAYFREEFEAGKKVAEAMRSEQNAA
ncbi:MAG: DUF697 domain-containing protein [Magnetococcus sp. YQC-9]